MYDKQVLLKYGSKPLYIRESTNRDEVINVEHFFYNNNVEIVSLPMYYHIVVNIKID